MFVHAVYFWLRTDLTSQEHERFEAGVHSLLGIEGVKQGFLGVPDAGRPCAFTIPSNR